MGGVGGSSFDKWARFTQFGVRFMVKAAFHGHGCMPYGTNDVTCVGRGRLSPPAAISHLVLYHVQMVSSHYAYSKYPYSSTIIIVPLCLLHIFSRKSKLMLTSQIAYYIIITHLSYVTCSEGLSVHSVRYRPRHLLQGARTYRSRR